MPSSAVPSAPDVFVSLDAASPGRLGEVAALLDGAGTSVVVDHHASNPGFGDAAAGRPRPPATVTLVADLLDGLGVEPGPALATCLYAGLAADTGSFRFGNTRPRDPRAGRPAAGDRHRPRRDQPPAVRHRSVRLAGPAVGGDRPGGAGARTSAPAWCGPGPAPPRRPSTACPGSSWRRWSTSSAATEEADVACVLKGQDDGSWSVSLRSRGGTDLARVAWGSAGAGTAGGRLQLDARPRGDHRRAARAARPTR